MDICLFWQPATVLCVDWIVILWLNKLILLLLLPDGRVLHCAYRFAHVDGLTGGTMVRLRSEAIERYRVDYVAGFASAGFSYFLTNQRDNFELTNAGLLPIVSGNLTSRIIQVSGRMWKSLFTIPMSGSGIKKKEAAQTLHMYLSYTRNEWKHYTIWSWGTEKQSAHISQYSPRHVLCIILYLISHVMF